MTNLKSFFTFYHIKLLTGVFVDEWNGMIQFNNFKATPTQPRFKIKHDRTGKLRFLALKTVQGHIKLKDTIQVEGTIRKLMLWKHINGFVVFIF
jgi:hypothetical protein